MNYIARKIKKNCSFSAVFYSHSLYFLLYLFLNACAKIQYKNGIQNIKINKYFPPIGTNPIALPKIVYGNRIARIQIDIDEK